MVDVAKRHGVSSTYLARICRRLRVPTPGRGYWARVQAGKRVPDATRLPAARPGDEQLWSPDVPAWQRHRVRVEPELVAPELATTEPVELASSGPRHGLLIGAEEVFKRGEHRRDGYLRPRTRQLPDIVVTEGRLSAALRLANALYGTLESRGHSVVLAPSDQAVYRAGPEFPGDMHDFSDRSRWAPARATVAYVGSVAIGITVVETTTEQEVEYVDGKWVRVTTQPAREKRARERWRLNTILGQARRWMPSGQLSIIAYCPYRDAEWSTSWTEEAPSALRAQIPSIVCAIENAVPQLIADIKVGRSKREEQERQQAQEMARLEAEWAEEKRRRAIDEARETLLMLARQWVETEEIRRFLNDVASAIDDASIDGHERAELARRLQLARALLPLPTAAEHLLSWRVSTESDFSAV